MAEARNYRELMPQCAAFVAEMRAVFGPPVRIEAEENAEHIRYVAPALRDARVRVGGFRVATPVCGDYLARGGR